MDWVEVSDHKMDRVEVSIDPLREGHLFRLPSEFDPTKEKSKGGKKGDKGRGKGANKGGDKGDAMALPEKARAAGLKANRGKEAKGMEEVDAEEEDEKKAKKAKGKGKAAPAKVVTGAGSIMGFFSKK